MAVISASDTTRRWGIGRCRVHCALSGGFGGGGRVNFDDDPVADELFGAPVLADEGEEGLLDFVPLAGSRRQVTEAFSLVRLTSVLRGHLVGRATAIRKIERASLSERESCGRRDH
jgi:hypothetical protein